MVLLGNAQTHSVPSWCSWPDLTILGDVQEFIWDADAETDSAATNQISGSIPFLDPACTEIGTARLGMEAFNTSVGVLLLEWHMNNHDVTFKV